MDKVTFRKFLKKEKNELGNSTESDFSLVLQKLPARINLERKPSVSFNFFYFAPVALVTAFVLVFNFNGTKNNLDNLAEDGGLNSGEGKINVPKSETEPNSVAAYSSSNYNEANLKNNSQSYTAFTAKASNKNLINNSDNLTSTMNSLSESQSQRSLPVEANQTPQENIHKDEVLRLLESSNSFTNIIYEEI